MKNVTEYAPFAAATELLQRLTEKRDALAAERESILNQMRGDSDAVRVLDQIDRARAVMDGENVPLNRGAAFAAFQERELQIREQLEVLNAALRTQPEAIEMERLRARALAIASREKELSAVRLQLNDACSKLMAAMAAEDAFLADLVAGGFGLQEPGITAPPWINREFFIETERNAPAD